MKKKFLIMIFITAFMFVSGCYDWEKDVVINGVKFSKFSYSSMRGYLVEDTLIQGYPCKKNYVFFYSNGNLNTFQLSKSFEFSDFVIPAKTWCRLDKEGYIHTCFFSKDTEVQGYICKGSIMGLEGITTSFYKNGKLHYFFPRKDVEIDGIPCKASVFHPIQLYDNGRLRSCTLAKTITINEKEFQHGTKITLNQEGQVIGRATKLKQTYSNDTNSAINKIKESSESKIRVGIYDSRAIACAYWAEDDRLDSYHDSLNEQIAKAKAEGNEKLSEELDTELWDHRKLLHKQVFSNEPIDDVLGKIKDKIDEIVNDANVSAVVSKWDKKALKKYKGAELVDVTDLLVEKFNITEETLETIKQLKEKKPIPLWQLNLMMKFEDH